MRTSPVLVSGFICLLGLMPEGLSQEKARDARKIFAEMCASCHGANLEGAAAPALTSGKWKYGGDESSLAASIRNGHPEVGMPPFGPAISEKEIRGLVVYIREQAGHAAVKRTSPPLPSGDVPSYSKLHGYRVETAVAGLSEPWSICFLTDSRILITEKRGTLRVFDKGELLPPVSGTPEVDSGGQAGLFDVVAHPDFANNGWVYLAFSEPRKNAAGKNVCMTTVVRGRIRDNTWLEEQVVFRAPIETFRNTGGVHYGGRLAFDRAGYLFFSIGERGNQVNAQDLSLPNGKIHRLHDDGHVPTDNPFVNTPGAMPSIWSYGHRNPQGLRFNPATGELWEHEHGPRGGDELNLIQPGLNYGWPVATYGMNYNGTPMTDLTTRADFVSPVTYWIPSIAPCGMTFYTGDRFPKWKNHLFVSSLAAQELRRLEIKDGKVVDQEVVFKGIGRMRDVAEGPDGFIYVLLPDRVARLVPVSN